MNPCDTSEPHAEVDQLPAPSHRPPQQQRGPKQGPKAGQNRGGFLPQGNIFPPKQKQVLSRGGGAPKPINLTTVTSVPRNDPMHREALMPNIGQEGRPVAEELSVYPGFLALTDVAREVHKHIAVSDSGISRKVPQSASAYYTGVLCYARLLKVEEFMRLVYEGDFRPPEPIAFYLQGLGCTTLQNQRELRFRMRPRRYVAYEDGSFGWFGRVDGNTHYLYASYPCLAVFIKRIQEDFNFTTNPALDLEWNLPDDIAQTIITQLPSAPTVAKE